MNIKNCAQRSIEKCGEEITLEKDGTTYSTLAVIQPLRYKNSSYFENLYVPEGYYNGNSYIYIGKPDVGIELLTYDSTITATSGKYVVKRVEKVCYGSEVIYIWALLQKCVEEE